MHALLPRRGLQYGVRMSADTPLTDLYVKLGRLTRENGELRASLRLMDIEMARMRVAHLAFYPHRADCPGCPLCITEPAPATYSEAGETAPDGRLLR